MQLIHRFFEIIELPSYQFHLIADLAPFTKAQKRESMLLSMQTSTDRRQMNLVVRDKGSSAIAGAAVLHICPTELIIRDFYILDRYRKKGAGSMIMEQIESIAKERHIPKINTGNSLHADNHIMIAFLEHKGFVRTPFEIHYFFQALAEHEARITYLDTHDYSYFIPKNNAIIPFSDEYFDPVFEMALEVFNEHPFYSEELIYQTLLLSSEKYSQLLVEGDQTNGFAIFWVSGRRIHLHFVAVRDEYQMSGVPAFLVGVGLKLAYHDGKDKFSYIAYKTDRLFRNLRQIVKKPNYIVIQMEKTL